MNFYLLNPDTNEKIDLKSVKYFNDIPDLFYSDKNEITETQSEFYNEILFPNYDDIDDFGTLLDKSNKSLYTKKLDEEIPYHANLLEAGCGTGQLSISLSRFGRSIYGIDLSKGSLIEAKKFIDRNKIQNVKLYRMNIFKLCFPKNYFDVIISNGVLHHTFNAKLAFKKLIYHLKPGGVIVIGLYHKYGRLIQNIRQILIRLFGEKFKFLDRRFSESFSDKKKYAWFRDQYKNPYETKHSYSEIIKWFNEEKIEYLNSIPFDFKPNEKLFFKKKQKNKLELFFKELSLSLSPSQIYEGGFFVMIGKKIK